MFFLGVDHPPFLGHQAPPDVFRTLIALELRTRGMAISVRLEGAAAPLQMLSTLARKGNSACAAATFLGGNTGNAQHANMDYVIIIHYPWYSYIWYIMLSLSLLLIPMTDPARAGRKMLT